MTIDMQKTLTAGVLCVLLGVVGCEQPKPAKPVTQVINRADNVSEKPSGDDLTSEEPDSELEKVTSEPPASPVEPEEPATAANQPGNKVKLGSDELSAGIPGSGPLKGEEIDAWLADPKNHEVLEIELPLGLDAGAGQIKGLDKNPLTRAKIELGRQLYFDPRLSADGTVSCASCHHPDEGWAKHTQFGVGINSQQGGRNSPVSFNRILSDVQFWDGRAASLEEQAKGPIQNPIEMGNTHEACISSITSIPGYVAQFDKVFGELTIDTVAQAIAAFERSIVTNPSPFDYYERFRPMKDVDPDDLDGEDRAKYDAVLADANAHPMSDSAKRGREIFFGTKGNCTACHVGPNLSDEKYHNLGVGMDKEKPDIGREEVTKDEKDHGAFKTPTIRNVASTAPYMHDGSQKTLVEVVEWYNKGGHPNSHLSDKVKKLELTDEEKADLVAFMEACTGDFPKVETGRLPE